MTEVEPFRIDVSEADLADLRGRLGRTRWPERECVADWSQGPPLAYAQELCRYWAEDYDWRRWEARLNGWDSARTIIDGLGIHFLHVRSPHRGALPLVVTHGWPGSVAEFSKVIGPLTDPAAHGGDPADALIALPSSTGDLSEQEQDALDALQHYERSDSGYSKEQSTRPQTVGYGLVDSPAGQAAWIVEKFWSWMDCNGHPEIVLTKDELLDNVSMYWLTASGASSARLYWESFNSASLDPVTVPSGVTRFPKELFRPSRRWAEQRFTDLRYWNEADKGGHFAALEQPELYVDEIRKFFRLVR